MSRGFLNICMSEKKEISFLDGFNLIKQRLLSSKEMSLISIYCYWQDKNYVW